MITGKYKAETVYLATKRPCMTRLGEWAMVIGVSMIVNTSASTPKLCYHLRYSDGFEDYLDVALKYNYTIKTLTELTNGK